MGRPRKPIVDETVAKWLKEEFKAEKTRTTYLAALRKFKKNLGIKDLGEYLKGEPDVTSDLRKFLVSLDGKPSKTVNNYVVVVKVFLQDHGIEVPANEWRKFRKRGFLPKRVRAETQDKKPSKAELRRILNYADIKCRSLVLFLASSGARIGETLQLKISDLDLDADPPKATIRSDYTKGGVGGRIVYFSYEARDAIKDWLEIKDKTSRRAGGGTYKSERVFPWDDNSSRFMWNRACDKAGLGERDKVTGIRVHHLHTLRKFFRTNIGLDLDFTHALMGHAEYLDDAYLRLEEKGEIAKAYLAAMKNLSIYSATTSRKEEIRRALAMQGLTLQDVIAALGEEMYVKGEGTGGGVSRKLPIDEDYITSLEDEEIGKYALKALRRKLLGETETNGGVPRQKVIMENELEAYLAEGWLYVNGLNNGSGKCIVSRP